MQNGYRQYDGNEEVVDKKAIVLRATDTVSVFINNLATYSFDASFVLPVESLGAEYIIQTDKQSASNNFNSYMKETSAFLIVAVEDDTEVEITPSVKTLTGHGAGVSYTVMLSAGQTYFVKSNNDLEWRDLSGSTIFARNGKKIAVFNGNAITRIPGDATNGRDHIFEQALPIDSLGRRFVITSSEGRSRDIVKITSSADDNYIYRDGEEIAIIGYGESWEFDLSGEDGSCFVETSEPSVVYVYHTSWQDPFEPSSSRLGNPSMVWIPPVEQRIKALTFCTFNSEQNFGSIANHYVNVVVHRLDADKLYIDGELVSSSELRPVTGSDDGMNTEESRCKKVSPVYLTGRGNDFTAYFYESPQTKGSPEHAVVMSGTLSSNCIKDFVYGYKIMRYNDSIVSPVAYPVNSIFILKDCDGLAETCTWFNDTLFHPQNNLMP